MSTCFPLYTSQDETEYVLPDTCITAETNNMLLTKDLPVGEQQRQRHHSGEHLRRISVDSLHRLRRMSGGAVADLTSPERLKARLSSVGASYHKLDLNVEEVDNENDHSVTVHLNGVSTASCNGDVKSSEASSIGTLMSESDNDDDILDDLGVHTIVLDLSAVSFVDIVGIVTIKSMVAEYEKIGINVVLAQCRGE